MNKVSLVVALLLFATTAYAVDVTITVTKVGSVNVSDSNHTQKVAIGFNGLADNGTIAGFALSLTTDSNATMGNVLDFNVGESNGGAVPPGKNGFGIFPASFRNIVNASYADACMHTDGRYSPLATYGDPNYGWGTNTGWIVLELGALWAGDVNKPAAPNGGSTTLYGQGTLCTLDVNFQNHGAYAPGPNGNECNIIINPEMVRGGVVKNDATAATTNMPVTLHLTDTQPGPWTISGRIVGAGAPLDTKGIEGIRLVGFPAEVNTDASGNFTATVPGGWSGTCTPTDFNNQWTWAPTNLSWSSVSANQSGANFTGTATECLNAKDVGYATWKSTTFNKPACWCNRRQCRGATKNAKSGFWVYTADLNLLKSTYGKNDTVVAAASLSGVAGICANFDHVKSGFQVYSIDLSTIKSYYGKSDALVPECNLAPVSGKVNRWNN